MLGAKGCCFFLWKTTQNLFMVNFCKVCIFYCSSPPFSSPPLCSALPCSLPPSFFPFIRPIYLPLCSRSPTILPHNSTQALVTWLLLCWARRVVIHAQGFPALIQRVSAICLKRRRVVGGWVAGTQVTLCAQIICVSPYCLFFFLAN